MNTYFAKLIEILPIRYFVSPSARVFWLYLFSSALLALVITFYAAFSQQSLVGDSCTIRQRVTKIFALQNLKKYWFSKDSKLDYSYFLVVWYIKIYLISPLTVSGERIAMQVISWLNVWHPPLFLQWNTRVIAFSYTLVLFVASDFTRYWLHRWLHYSDILWQIHKVHHSAGSLNPFTFYRTHPLENFLFGTRYALTAGLVTGVFLWLFGAALSVVSILGGNIFIVFFSLAGTNLRHSHIKLAYPRKLESYFISPAQHQLHHDANFARKNYGGYLAIWDRLFGSLVKTHEVKRRFVYGFFENEKLTTYSTLKQLLLQPFIDIYIFIKIKWIIKRCPHTDSHFRNMSSSKGN